LTSVAANQQVLPACLFLPSWRVCKCGNATMLHRLDWTCMDTAQENTQQVTAPAAARRYAPADGSSTRGGSTSVRGRVRSPHISGGRPGAGSQRADSLRSCATQPACYSLGWGRQTGGQTDGSRYRLMPPTAGGIIICCYSRLVAALLLPPNE